MSDFDRLAQALALFEEFERRPMDVDAWLARHEPYRELLEPMVQEYRNRTLPEEVGPAGSPNEVPIARSPVTGSVETLGPFRVVETLGEGGMGTVYLAEQTEPIQRQVALKVIRVGMSSMNIIRRFEAERQALALMDHPNIARVLEAGNTSDGCPYFVMEYVQGAELIQHCDRSQLPIRKRVELFAAVCDGVQHAHQRGIIHRDLKPSNILVSLKEGRVTPKIIDFGIAKATQTSAIAQSLYATAPGGVVGTPAYMSPEQLDPTTLELDTRTDIYSLGVVLYELLVGQMPYPVEGATPAGLVELTNRIRTAEPKRPSTHIHGLGDTAHESARQRGTSVGSWRRELSRELDWIALRCLEKDPDRRYASASDLGADLRRYLADDPVLARPPSNAYRLRKIVRKHRGLVTTVALVFLSLIGGLGWALVEKSRADDQAEELARQVYRGNLVVAADAIEDGRTPSARQFLMETREDLRDWEWRHLVSKLDQSLSRFELGTGEAKDLFVAPDDKTFLLANAGSLSLRSVSTGESLLELPVNGRPIRCALTPDGKEIIAVVAGSEGERSSFSVATWRVADGELLTLFQSDGEVATEQISLRWAIQGAWTRCSIDARRRRIAFATSQTGVVMFDIDEQRVVSSRDFSEHAESDLHHSYLPIVSPSGNYVVILVAGETQLPTGFLFLLDAETLETRGRLAMPVGKGYVVDLAIRPDETQLAVGTVGGSIVLWDFAEAVRGDHSLKPELDFVSNQGGVRGLAYSADGSHLVSLGLHQAASLWDTETGQLTRRYPRQDSVNTTVKSLSRSEAFMTVDQSGTVTTWSLDQRDPAVLRGHRSYAYSVDVHEEYGLILTGAWDGFVGKSGGFRLWDLESGAPIAAWGDRTTWVQFARFLPDSDSLLGIEVRRLRSATSRFKIDGTSGAGDNHPHLLLEDVAPQSIHVGRNSETVWFITADGRLKTIDLASSALVEHRRFEATTWSSKWDSVRHQIALTPDERTIAIANGVDRFALYRWPELTLLRELVPHDMNTSMLHFDPSGRRLVSASEDGTARVWDVESGTEIARLTGHELGILCARFSPDGRRIATGSRDKTLRIWSAETYQELAALTGHDRYIYDLTWQEDGERIFTASGDHTVRIWETQEARNRLCARREREAIVKKLTPRVEAWLEKKSDEEGLADFLRTATELSDREVQIARQILIHHALDRGDD